MSPERSVMDCLTYYETLILNCLVLDSNGSFTSSEHQVIRTFLYSKRSECLEKQECAMTINTGWPKHDILFVKVRNKIRTKKKANNQFWVKNHGKQQKQQQKDLMSFFSTNTDRAVAVCWDWRVGCLHKEETTQPHALLNVTVCLWAPAPSPFPFPRRSKAFNALDGSLVWPKVSSVKRACCLYLCSSSASLRDPRLHLNRFSDALKVLGYTPTDSNFGNFHHYYLLAFTFKQTS